MRQPHILFYRIRSSSNSSAANHKMFVLITILAVNACIAGTIPATPENITVTFLTPTTVRVSWQTMIDLNAHPIEKYIVTYKPTDDRVVQDVAGNSEAIILDRLSPSTQYSIAVTAIWLGKKYRSRQIIFRTLDMPKTSSQQDLAAGPHGGNALGRNSAGSSASTNAAAGVNPAGRAANASGVYNEDVTSTATNTLSHGTHRELPTIRGVEIGIVLIVLMVWAGAIALFFNRWGKIRMLLPYQPDYKHEQLKVPGTGVCSGGVCNGQHSHQHFHMLQEEHSASISERCTRSRINSAIFVSSEGRGFDSIEFLRRHGSQSVLCRKARSAENITDNERKKSFSENKRQWCTDNAAESSAHHIEKVNFNDADAMAIELQQCTGAGAGMDTRTLAVLKFGMGDEQAAAATALTTVTSMVGHSAAVTTSTTNVVVGSISIEAPPAYMEDDINSAVEPQPLKQQQRQPAYSGMSSTNSASHDSSTDTVEELILIPAAAAAAAKTIESSKTHVLVRQRSSNASASPHNSPKTLSLKGVKPKVAAALPMVSVSGPSPPHDKPTPQPPAEGL